MPDHDDLPRRDPGGAPPGNQGPEKPAPELDVTLSSSVARTISSGGGGSRPGPSGPAPTAIGGYRILRVLGEGGMGIVYEAEQQNPRRLVALKVVRGGHFVDEATVRMFRREAETLARLRHPNIGAIYESGRTEDGQHFFAMELVQGDNLDVYLAKRGRATSPEEVRFRLALFRRIAEAVHYAHLRGVIHRDLKPSNIVISREAGSSAGAATLSGVRLPDVKILDFGLARITEGDVQATQMTEVGVIKGTLPYMAPEQARGHAEAIDVRTDVYALGVLLYEMLSGARPYDVSRGSLIEAVRIICEEPPRSLRSSLSGTRRLDPDIETIVGKALEKDADRRYATAAAMYEDVERYLASQPILARPPSTVYQLRKFAGRNRALVAGITATFVVLMAGAIVSSLLASAARRCSAATERSRTATTRCDSASARRCSARPRSCSAMPRACSASL
ncbi:MAG TPA: serine/threonine-protein kinase, partial [Candidatus Saccharimonadales bacterium]|nr:serine/threonine-protein kinase [Candidatus Saccharimonadales bacterium]